MTDFTRHVQWEPAGRKLEEGLGRWSLTVRFVLIGPQAAIQFALMTGWLTKQDREDEALRESMHKTGGFLGRVFCINDPLPSDFGYHAREPQRDGQEPSRENCEYLGAPCYYDGSTARAARLFDLLTDEGEDAVWKALEEEYEARFVVGVPPTIESATFGEAIEMLRDLIEKREGHE